MNLATIRRRSDVGPRPVMGSPKEGFTPASESSTAMLSPPSCWAPPREEAAELVLVFTTYAAAASITTAAPRYPVCRDQLRGRIKSLATPPQVTPWYFVFFSSSVPGEGPHSNVPGALAWATTLLQLPGAVARRRNVGREVSHRGVRVEREDTRRPGSWK